MNKILLSTVAASLLALTPAVAAETGTPAAGTTAPEAAPMDPSHPVPHGNPTKDAAATEALPAVPAEARTATVYANMAAGGDSYEVKAAEVAMERSENANVKALADMIAKDHTASSAELVPIVTGMGGTLPTELDAKHQAMVDALEKAEDADFDRTYLDQQVKAHQEALALHRMYAAEGDNETLKAFAAKVTPKIEAHLAQAQTMLAAMPAATSD